MICLSIFRLHEVGETTSVDYGIDRIDTYLILTDSSGSSGKVTPATSGAPVSTWSVSIETRVSFSSLFLAERTHLCAREIASEVLRGEKVGWHGVAGTEAADIKSPESYQRLTLTR